MNILLDTCTFLWIIIDADELSAQARTIFQDTANDIFLSTISEWEISLKYSLGRLPFPDNPEKYIPRQREKHKIAILPLNEESALKISHLPLLHKDPFDRMLICQAISHGLIILTPDLDIQKYSVRTMW